MLLHMYLVLHDLGVLTKSIQSPASTAIRVNEVRIPPQRKTFNFAR